MATVRGRRIRRPFRRGAFLFACGGQPCRQPARRAGQRRAFALAEQGFHVLLGARVEAAESGTPAFGPASENVTYTITVTG